MTSTTTGSSSRIRKAPQPQCSFQIRFNRSAPNVLNDSGGDGTTTCDYRTDKVKSFTTITTIDPNGVSIYSSCSSNITPTRSRKDTSPTSSMIDPNNNNGDSKIMGRIPRSPSTKTSAMTTSVRDISPLKKNTVRRSHSFDDSYSPTALSPKSATGTTNHTLARPGGRRKGYCRSSSLPTPIKKNVTFNEVPHIVVVERMVDILLSFSSSSSASASASVSSQVPPPTDTTTMIKDLWWTTEEYNDITKEYESILYLLDHNKEVDETYDTTRGLHNRTELGAWEMYEKQRNARNAVLHQQDIFRKKKKSRSSSSTNTNSKNSNENIDISTAIAEAYMKETIHLREHAIKEAQNDYKIAMEYLNIVDGRQQHLLLSSSSTSLGLLEESISDLSLLRVDIDNVQNSDHDTNHTSTDSITITAVTPNSNIPTSSLQLRAKELQKYQDSFQINDQPHRGGGGGATSPSSFRRTDTNGPDCNGSFQFLPSVLENSCLSLLNGELVHQEEEEEDDDDDNDCENDDDVDNRSTDMDVRSVESIPRVKEPKGIDHKATKVRFASKTQKIKRSKVKDQERDIKKRWYTKDELIQMAKHVNRVIDMIETESTLTENDTVMESKYKETRRGLEKATEEGARKLYICRRTACNAVLTLQKQQQETNRTIDHAALANVYINFTKDARDEAVRIGKQDAKEARRNRLRRRSFVDPETAKESSNDASRGRRQSISDLFDEDAQEKSISPPRERSLNSSMNDFRSNESSMCSIRDLEADDFIIDTGILIADEIGDCLEQSINIAIDDGGQNRSFVRPAIPKNQNFVRSSAQMFDRQARMLEFKKAEKNFKLPGRLSSAPNKLFTLAQSNLRINPYNATSNDESTNNDESLVEDTPYDVKELKLTNDIPNQEQIANDKITNDIPNLEQIADDKIISGVEEARLLQLLNSFNTSIKDIDCETHDKKHSTAFWLKVNSLDCKEILLENGDVVYLLRNAEKFDNPPTGGNESDENATLLHRK